MDSLRITSGELLKHLETKRLTKEMLESPVYIDYPSIPLLSELTSRDPSTFCQRHNPTTSPTTFS